MSLLEVLRNHISYSEWASARLLDAAAELTEEERQRDFETADKSVEGTLLHLMRAERAWLARVQRGVDAARQQMPTSEGWEQVQSEWRKVHQAWATWAIELKEPEVETSLTYLDFKGKQWTSPVWQVVLHLVNHSTHHRGQVSGFLRSLGKTPPPLDFIAYMRQLGS